MNLSPRRTHSAIEIQSQVAMDIFEAWSQVREYMDHEAGKLRRLAKITPVKPPVDVSWTSRPSNGKRKEPEVEVEDDDDDDDDDDDEEEVEEKKQKKKPASAKKKKKKKVDGPKRLTAHNVFMSQFMADPEKKRSKEEKSFHAASTMWNSIKNDKAKVAVYDEIAKKMNAEALEKWTEAKKEPAVPVATTATATAVIAAPPPPASSASSSESSSSEEEESEQEEEEAKPTTTTRRAMQIVDDEASD